MRFHCAACGREMQAEEALSFCPFCGKPYQGEARAAQVVIAGDSERAVQEKYWEEASNAISFLTKYLKPEKSTFERKRAGRTTSSLCRSFGKSARTRRSCGSAKTGWGR